MVQYIINGIPDTNINKAILHNANNIVELKTALKKYQNITAFDMKYYRNVRPIENKPYFNQQNS